MQVPFGISQFTGKDGKTSWSLPLAFKDMDQDSKLQTLFNNMLKVDELAVQAAVANSESWFNKKLPDLIVQEFQHPCITPETKSKKNSSVYPPSFKVKLPASTTLSWLHCNIICHAPIAVVCSNRQWLDSCVLETWVVFHSCPTGTGCLNACQTELVNHVDKQTCDFVILCIIQP